MAVAQPMWSRVDEAQHSDYVAHLARGEWPVEGRTRITADTLEVMGATGVYRWHLPGAASVPDPGEVAAEPPGGAGRDAVREWTVRHLWTYSYEAAQPPLFYLLAAPFHAAGRAAGGPVGAVYAVRLFNAALVAALAPLAALASLLVHRGGGRAVAAAVVAGLLPGMVLNGTAVTNDTLAAVLGGVLTVLCLLGVRRGWSSRLALLTGLVFGAALLAKLTAAGLAVGLATAMLWPLITGRVSVAGFVKSALTAGAASAAVLAPWLAANLAIYGHPLAGREADALLGSYFGPMVLSPAAVAASFKNGFATFWTGEPFNTLPIGRPLTGLCLAWCLLATVGIQRILRPAGSRAAATAVAAIAVGTAAWAFCAMLASHIGGLLPGRYSYPALVAVAVVLAQGGAAVARGRLRLLAPAGLAAFMLIAVADIGGFAAGFSGAGRPVTVPPPAPGRALAATASMSDVSMAVDRVVRDPASGRVFVHVAVSNAGASRVEWRPVAVARFRGRAEHVDSNYAEGSRLPEELAPGSVVEGWVVFDRLTAAEVAAPFRVGFLGVAAAGYRVYGDLVTEVPAG